MPTPWIQNDVNPGWIGSQTYGNGTLVEFMAYDDEGVGQGRVLGEVVDTLRRSSTSVWLDVTVIAIQDESLHWWMMKGPGKKLGGQIELHVCHGLAPKCKAKANDEKMAFHTDVLRVVTPEDIKKRIAKRWTEKPGKEGFEDFRKHLVEKEKEGQRKGKPRDEDDFLDFSPSGEEDPEPVEEEPEEPDRGKKERGLRARLEKLKSETKPKEKVAEKKKQPEKPRKERKKKDPEESEPAKAVVKPVKKKRKKPRRRSPEEEGEWFGRMQVSKTEPEESDDEEEEAEESSEPAPVEKKKRKKRKEWSKKTKKKKEDRGPFGMGRKVVYQEAQTEEETDSDEESGSSFQAGAPEKRSQQLILMEYADQKPGRLAARLLQKMASLASRSGAPMSSVLAKSKTPAAAVQYYLTVLYPQHKEKMSLRVQRELRTLSQAIDALALGQVERSADLIGQRLKALELSLHDQGRHRAQYLELIPMEGIGLADVEEQRMATKEQVTEAKARKWQPAGRKGQGYQEADQKGGKGKWKGNQKKGDKGKGKGTTVQEEKTPTA